MGPAGSRVMPEPSPKTTTARGAIQRTGPGLLWNHSQTTAKGGIGCTEAGAWAASWPDNWRGGGGEGGEAARENKRPLSEVWEPNVTVFAGFDEISS